MADWAPPGYAGLTWDRLDWLKDLTGLPLVVKGIRTIEDAVMCAEYGADGIVVSNHGGRQIDGTRASIETLPEIADAVGRQPWRSILTPAFDADWTCSRPSR